MNGYQIVSEALIFSQDDLLYKFDDWSKGKQKILLMTGLSGSGKTTLGKQLAKEHNAEWATMDFTPPMPKKEREFIDKNYSGEERIEKLQKLYYKHAMKFINKPRSKKLVYEGIQLFFWLPPEVIANYSVIIKGESYLTVMLRIAKSLKKDGSSWESFLRSMSNISKRNRNMLKELRSLRKYLEARQ